MPAFYEVISWKYYSKNNVIAISMGTTDVLALLLFSQCETLNSLGNFLVKFNY